MNRTFENINSILTRIFVSDYERERAELAFA